METFRLKSFLIIFIITIFTFIGCKKGDSSDSIKKKGENKKIELVKKDKNIKKVAKGGKITKNTNKFRENKKLKSYYTAICPKIFNRVEKILDNNISILLKKGDLINRGKLFLSEKGKDNYSLKKSELKKVSKDFNRCIKPLEKICKNMRDKEGGTPYNSCKRFDKILNHKNYKNLDKFNYYFLKYENIKLKKKIFLYISESGDIVESTGSGLK